jgi:hypothetical protein
MAPVRMGNEIYRALFLSFFLCAISSGVIQVWFDIKYSPFLFDGSWLALSF